MALKEAVTYTQPNSFIADKDKDEDYHKNWTLSIVNRNLDYNYDLEISMMNESYRYYEGSQSESAFKFLQEAEDGDTLPAQWINYNGIKTRVDVVLGEEYAKGYDIQVKAQDKALVSKKLKMKEDMRVEMRLQELAQELTEEFGLDLTQQGLPESEAELEEYFNYTYKELSEIIMRAALKYCTKLSDWDYQRMAVLRDVLITNRGFYKTEIINGIPKVRRVDPRYILFDRRCEDDLLSDATYWGEIRYMEIGDAAEHYGLTKEELEESFKAYKNYEKDNKTSGGPTGHNFDSLGGTSVSWYRDVDDNKANRVLVFTAYWQDTIDYNHKSSIDSHGNEHLKKVTASTKKRKGDDIKVSRAKVWRTATIIGGQFIKDWGVAENLPRNPDDLQAVQPPYFGVVPSYLNYKTISKVDQMKGMQNLKNIAMYNVQLAMSRSGAKGFVYDVSQTPEGWDVATVMKYLKTVGIAFIDSMKDGLPSGYNQFKEIDLSISSSVDRYIQIAMMCDNEMDKVSGINAERQGQVSSPYTAVGVTQAALVQSNLTTELYNRLFRGCNSNALRHMAGLVKLAWVGKERFAPIIGDVGVDFLEMDVDLDLHEYGVFVEEINPILDDLRYFQTFLTAMVQAGQLDGVAALKLLREKDIDVAIRQLEKYQAEKEKKDFEQQQALQQQASQARMQENQGELGADMMLKKMDGQNKMNVAQKQGEYKLAETGLKAKTDINLNLLDAVKTQIQMNKLRQQGQK
jgi:hypothetical protein